MEQAQASPVGFQAESSDPCEGSQVTRNAAEFMARLDRDPRRWTPLLPRAHRPAPPEVSRRAGALPPADVIGEGVVQKRPCGRATSPPGITA